MTEPVAGGQEARRFHPGLNPGDREAQLRRREFIQHQIPALVANELGELDARMRKQVEALMKQLISDYSVESFNSIHKALEQYWSGK